MMLVFSVKWGEFVYSRGSASLEARRKDQRDELVLMLQSGLRSKP